MINLPTKFEVVFMSPHYEHMKGDANVGSRNVRGHPGSLEIALFDRIYYEFLLALHSSCCCYRVRYKPCDINH